MARDLQDGRYGLTHLSENSPSLVRRSLNLTIPAAALCGIKEAGGITIAQKLETAAQPDMPESAIATGCIDFVLSPEDIAREIVRIARGDTLRKQSGI